MGKFPLEQGEFDRKYEHRKMSMIDHRLQTWIRVGWAGALLVSLAVLLLSIPGYLDTPERSIQGQIAEGPLTIIPIGALWAGVILPIAASLLSISLGVLIYWRKPAEPMALFSSFYLLSYAMFMTGPLEAANAYWVPQQPELALVLQSVYFPVMNVALLLVFPNGRFQPGWTKYLVVLSIIISIGATFIDSGDLTRPRTWQALLITAANFGILFLSIIIQLYRYRSIYTHIEKQQAKWALLGIIFWFIGLGLSSIFYYQILLLPPDAPTPWWVSYASLIWYLVLGILPVSFAIAILKSRLWEIDLIIRRTLVYTVLTAMLALVYFGSVVLLQTLFESLTGQGSPLAIVISTLGIAALFTPLRRRVQDAIDRRFYRGRYNAEQVLTQFASAAQRETDLKRLTDELIGTVNETMQPESVNLWIAPTNQFEGSFGDIEEA